MSYSKALDALQKVISKIDITHNPLIDELNKEEPVIYLCGKSATGKTKFLNALLNREKDEFFISTDISTQAEFRFIYGDEQMYQIKDGDKQLLPITYTERKELFIQLNQRGNKCTIWLQEKALKGRIIVDIPGILDFSHSTEHAQKMINEADIVCFFTPCIGKVNAQEYTLLKKISDADIPIVILFTMGDITEPDEGITRKTLPDYVQNRINSKFSEIKTASHFIISASDFYKEKDSHGIDTFLSHIQSNEVRYLDNAQNGRLRRLFRYYIEHLENEIATLREDAEQVENLNKRENELWFKSQKTEIENEIDLSIRTIYRDLEGLNKQCKDRILGYVLKSETYADEIISAEERKESFVAMWEDFWKQLQIKHTKIITQTQSLPPIPSALFQTPRIDIEEIGRIKNELFKATIFGEDNPELNSIQTVLDSITLEDLKRFGINLDNTTFIFSSINYFSNVTGNINEAKETALSKSRTLLERRENELREESEKRIKNAIAEDVTIQRLENYQSAVNELKKFPNYAS